MKWQILFLKIAVILLGVPVLLLCLYGLNAIAHGAGAQFPAYLAYPGFIGLYLAAVPFFTVLYQTVLLLGAFQRDNPFSAQAVKALHNIKICAAATGALFIVVLPFLYVAADSLDAPGILAMGLAALFFSAIAAAFASVLQALITRAMDNQRKE